LILMCPKKRLSVSLKTENRKPKTGRCRACGAVPRKGRTYCSACLARAARRLVEYQAAVDAARNPAETSDRKEPCHARKT